MKEWNMDSEPFKTFCPENRIIFNLQQLPLEIL